MDERCLPPNTFLSRQEIQTDATTPMKNIISRRSLSKKGIFFLFLYSTVRRKFYEFTNHFYSYN
jgi:hypothetical protein